MAEHGQQRLTAEQRQRLEEEEARREAERAEELARQRAVLQESEQDRYVARRMEKELAAIAEVQRLAEAEELAKSGGVRDSNPAALLALGLALGVLLLGVIYFLSTR